jgi:hypothetical protein
MYQPHQDYASYDLPIPKSLVKYMTLKPHEKEKQERYFKIERERREKKLFSQLHIHKNKFSVRKTSLQPVNSNSDATKVYNITIA